MIDHEDRKTFVDQLRTRRRRGRPRSAQPAVVTSVRIPLDTYDELCHRAHLDRQSVHATLKDALSAYIRSA